jgi:hypothetical protein
MAPISQKKTPTALQLRDRTESQKMLVNNLTKILPRLWNACYAQISTMRGDSPESTEEEAKQRSAAFYDVLNNDREKSQKVYKLIKIMDEVSQKSAFWRVFSAAFSPFRMYGVYSTLRKALQAYVRSVFHIFGKHFKLARRDARNIEWGQGALGFLPYSLIIVRAKFLVVADRPLLFRKVSKIHYARFTPHWLIISHQISVSFSFSFLKITSCAQDWVRFEETAVYENVQEDFMTRDNDVPQFRRTLYDSHLFSSFRVGGFNRQKTWMQSYYPVWYLENHFDKFDFKKHHVGRFEQQQIMRTTKRLKKLVEETQAWCSDTGVDYQSPGADLKVAASMTAASSQAELENRSASPSAKRHVVMKSQSLAFDEWALDGTELESKEHDCVVSSTRSFEASICWSGIS